MAAADRGEGGDTGPVRSARRRAQRLWTRFVTIDGHASPDDPEFRRIYLINVLLLATIAVCAFFLGYQLIKTGRFNLLAGINAYGVVAAAALIGYLRVARNVERVATISNVIAIAGLVCFLALEHRYDAGAIWAPLYYPFAFFLKGKRTGLRYAAVYTLLVVVVIGADSFVVNPLDQESAVARLLNVSVGLMSAFAFFYYYEATRADAVARLVAARERLTELSTTDELTGLYNRRQFDGVFPAEIKRAYREGRDLALLLLDVDFFKAYNDHYGHPAGDRVLQQVAQVMRRRLQRSSDLVFRLGGEEFGAVVAVDAPAAAEAMAESIRRSIEALGLCSAGAEPGIVTASIGLRVLAHTAPQPEREAARLVSEADRALYQAKEQGRNRVVSYADATSLEIPFSA